MAQTYITVVQGDENYEINFTLTDANGNVLDLTGSTLAFNAQLLSDSSVHFAGSMSIVSATDGTCKYTVASTDFPVSGTYNCQIEVNYSASSEKITFSDIEVVVEDRVPVS